MLIPLWLPWTVLLAATLWAALAQDAQRRWAPDPSRWAVVAVALVVAASLSADRFLVDEDELRDVVDQVAAEVDGTVGTLTATRLGALVEQRLGREVEVEEVEDSEPTDLVVGIGDAHVCVTVYGEGGLGEPATTGTTVNTGSCH